MNLTLNDGAPQPSCCEPKRFFTSKLWIEGEAEAQLLRVASFEGAIAAFAMPDLHPGKGVPIGCALVTERLFYPHLAGNDLGCGALACELVGARRLSPDALAKAKWFRGPPDFSDWDEHMEKYGSLWSSLGLDPERNVRSIGGGNHFLEICVIDEALGNEPPMARGAFLALAHSGSRHLGEAVARSWSDRHGAAPAQEGSAEAEAWLRAHDACLDWARVNRMALARSAAQTLGCDVRALSDTCHNAIEKISASRREELGLPTGTLDAYIHRKGAAKADGALALLPGSRGDYSYLVRPTGARGAAESLAHGAGRKWKRSDCEGRLLHLTHKDLSRTRLGSRVLCEDKALLFEEAPQAYKDCASVLAALMEHGLAEPVARLRPLLTLKI